MFFVHDRGCETSSLSLIGWARIDALQAAADWRPGGAELPLAGG